MGYSASKNWHCLGYLQIPLYVVLNAACSTLWIRDNVYYLGKFFIYYIGKVISFCFLVWTYLVYDTLWSYPIPFVEISWCCFKYISKNIYICLGQGSKLRQEFDIGREQRSRLRINTAEEYVPCILIILLSLWIQRPWDLYLCLVCSLLNLFISCLFFDYFVYASELTIFFACT